MADDTSRQTHATRRKYLEYGSTVVAGGLLAGCVGESSRDSTPDSTETDSVTSTGTEVDTTTSTSTETDTTTPTASYDVSIEPVGTVTFDAVPETWLPFTGDYADMGVALGQADGLAGIGVRRRFGTHLYDELPGVSVDESELTQLWQEGVDKEVFYEIDADVHVVDPNFAINRLQWDRDDVEELRERIAPFFGNTTFTQVYDWHDYRYYDLYEAFEKVATVFQERARYEAFERLHDEVVGDVRDRLPAEKPDVAVLVPVGDPPEAFWPYRIGEGTASKHWNDLRVGDALAKNGVRDAQAGGGRVDYETLLEVDPDVVAIRLPGEVDQAWVDENVLAPMRDHPIASNLTAVENEQVVYGGMTYQGPIIHLFQLETAARGLYPDEFGDEQLFNRQRVAAIVDGSV